jgi:hypothetical protein
MAENALIPGAQEAVDDLLDEEAEEARLAAQLGQDEERADEESADEEPLVPVHSAEVESSDEESANEESAVGVGAVHVRRAEVESPDEESADEEVSACCI